VACCIVSKTSFRNSSGSHFVHRGGANGGLGDGSRGYNNIYFIILLVDKENFQNRTFYGWMSSKGF